MAKVVNNLVTNNKYKDYDLDNYLYVSLSQPPIKIIDRNGSLDELDFTVECPNCKKHVIYGENIFILNGYIYCDEKCREKLLKNNDYLRSKYGR